jgi:putative CocE/NonD family hydrolase
VRAASRAAGLRTWDKPAAACLASRIPYGTPVTIGVLRSVEDAEHALRTLGFGALRVRHYGDLARLEVPVADFDRVLEARDDVLVYTSDKLHHDLDAIGPVDVVLYAATSARDTDWIVRLCDVHPDGKSIFVTEGIIRARYRNSHEGDSTELLEPGEPAEYRIRCYPMANRFKKGHRIRLDVTSSSFPRFSRNLNTGEDVGTGTRMEVAHQTVLHTAAYPSHVVLPVVWR